jgi:hypothetical protein
MSALEELPFDEDCEYCGELQIDCKCEPDEITL